MIPTTWNDVMARLRGARLAVYDALLNRGELTVLAAAQYVTPYDGVQLVEAMQWLRAAHLVREVQPGLWRARTVADAQKQFLAAGGMIEEFMRGCGAVDGKLEAVLEASAGAPAPEFRAVNSPPRGVRVHDHQVELFAGV